MKPIAVIGNVNVDLILGPATPWPQPGTEIIVDHDELRVGGCAGNSALALKALGVPFALAASIGSDRFGAWLPKSLAISPSAGGYTTRTPPSPSASPIPTASAPSSRRSATCRTTVPSTFWPPSTAKLIAPGYALFAGPFLMPRLAGEYDQLYDWADRFGIRVALDTGWPPAGWKPEVISAAKGWLARSSIAPLQRGRDHLDHRPKRRP